MKCWDTEVRTESSTFLEWQKYCRKVDVISIDVSCDRRWNKEEQTWTGSFSIHTDNKADYNNESYWIQSIQQYNEHIVTPSH